MISLSIGDPTHYKNMLPPIEAEEAVTEAVQKPTSHGYVPSFGLEAARQAVAELWTKPNCQLKFDDIILTSGCSHALEMCINCLANPGDNILLPRPGFSLYVTLCKSLNIETRFYDLIPDKCWEVDLDHLQSMINEKTKAILINNPSNPCGAVYGKEHLCSIIDLCEKNCLPIIADEIYADMFELALLFVFLDAIKPGLLDLSSRILGPNSIIQAALPYILTQTPQSYFDEIITQIQMNAQFCYETLSSVPGLKPIMPSGAMYMLVSSVRSST
ncbi:unnamed protein product [Didymodactylos carnosus]|uniref:Aminotransferase class I/classII large domain-containing protein n=1 Tax=Didymodactylos carnosus TaxID=1234261 RepID=A0A8S2EJQ6_9BILA|nr:unnamed protein product [Didymodactylos carnosus]CAF3992551.1 unnamed protein product [Didymodactylos carnosus]